MTLKCTFWGGVGSDNNTDLGELGGVQLLLLDETLNAKIMLDCGQRPDHWNQYYGFPYKPKAYQALDISERLELYKGLASVYRRDYQRHKGSDAQPDLDLEIIVTHPHFDHMGGLGLADHRVKTHIHKHGMTIAHLWQMLSGKTNNQFIDLIDQFSLVNKSDGQKKFASGMKALLGRNMHVFDDYEKFEIGDVGVSTYPIDHSVPGSNAFILDTSSGPISISGDIRFRGGAKDLTMKFIDDAIAADVRYAFWEGSLFHFEHNGTEADVARMMAELINDKKFAAYSAPLRDFSRLKSSWEAAKATKRILCIQPDQMLYLKAFNGSMGLPKVDDPNIAVLLLPKMKGLLDRTEFPEDMAGSDYFYWERQFIPWKKWQNTPPKKRSAPEQIALFEDEEKRGRPYKGKQRVTLEDIRDHPECFYVNMPFSRMADVLEVIQPPPNSKFLRSHPAPWTPDMEEQEKRQINLLRMHGMNLEDSYLDYLTPKKGPMKIPTVHVTGHFNKEEMRDVMSRFKPSVTTIVAYHCMHPSYFTNDLAKHLNVIVPTLGQRLIL